MNIMTTTTRTADAAVVLRRPLFFGPEPKKPDSVVFGGSIILILGLLLILSGCVLLTEDDVDQPDKFDIHSYHMMILLAGGLITMVGVTCFGVRALTARRVRVSIRHSFNEFAQDFSRRLQVQPASITQPDQSVAAAV
jgi:hypothetical protein